MLTFFVVRTLDVATLQRSLVSLLRYMLLRCRDVWCPCYVTCCYAAEISGILATLNALLRCRDLWFRCYVTCCYVAEMSGVLATLHVATLQRSLVSLLRYLLLRCRDLWFPCYVTCCYAAEISGILATLHVLLRCRDLWYPCYVTCCYAAEISGFLATLHVATLQRSLVSLLRYMSLRCRDLWFRCDVTIKCHTGRIDAACTSCKQFIPNSLGARHKDVMLYAKMWQWRFINKYKKLLEKTSTDAAKNGVKKMPALVQSK